MRFFCELWTRFAGVGDTTGILYPELQKSLFAYNACVGLSGVATAAQCNAVVKFFFLPLDSDLLITLTE